MPPRKVVLPSVFASVNSRPFESLERWMLGKVAIWDWPEELTDFETYLRLNRKEVIDEICGIWILMFRSKEALSTALGALIEDYNGGVLADFCRYYSKVLNETEIEVNR